MAEQKSFTESDWRKFRELVPQWRERYLKAKNIELNTLLNEPGKTPTEQFWNTKKLLDTEAKVLYQSFDGHSRSKMVHYLELMIANEIISSADFHNFGEVLQKRLGDFVAWRTRELAGRE